MELRAQAYHRQSPSMASRAARIIGMLVRSWTLHAPKKLLFLVSGVVSGLSVLGCL
jgi:hypothetical protein